MTCSAFATVMMKQHAQRVKTVEFIVETNPWTSPGSHYRDEELVPVRITTVVTKREGIDTE